MCVAPRHSTSRSLLRSSGMNVCSMNREWNRGSLLLSPKSHGRFMKLLGLLQLQPRPRRLGLLSAHLLLAAGVEAHLKCDEAAHHERGRLAAHARVQHPDAGHPLARRDLREVDEAGGGAKEVFSYRRRRMVPVRFLCLACSSECYKDIVTALRRWEGPDDDHQAVVITTSCYA